MVVRILGAQALVRLMSGGNTAASDLSWLLFGDPEVTADLAEDDLPVAAE